jgi:carbon storage regulator
MPVLTRSPQQSIFIDHDIQVTILSVDGKQVRIGIEAPEDVEIVREEIAEDMEG